MHNLLGHSIQTSMQNLESVAQKMAVLPLDTPESLPSDTTDKKSQNLLGHSIQTSMPNLESVAKKMAELLYNLHIPFFFFNSIFL